MTGAPAGSLVYAAHRQATTARRAAVAAAAARGETALLPATAAATVLDIAWANPTAAQIKATGASGVIGYLSEDPTKNLTASQVSAYVLGGVRVGTVWETTAGRAMAGYAAGQADARAAEAQRVSIGLPPTSLHRAAVDTDTTWATVAPYFEGWASVVGKTRLAAYGGYKITAGAYGYGLRRNWQTLAWSGGRLDPNAALYQNGRTALSGAADVNTVLAADWGQYPPLEAPVSTPTPEDIANAVWHFPLVDAENNQPVTPAAVMAWMDRMHGNQVTDITAAVTAVQSALTTRVIDVDTKVQAIGGELAAQLTAISGKIDALETTGLTDAQLTVLAAKVADVLAARLAG